MKNFIIKVFLFACGVVALFEGMLFSMIGLRRISPQDVISFYSFILRTPRVLNITLGLAAGFLFLGFILLTAAFRGSKKPKSILIKEAGEILRIPIDEVKDFIEQMLGQSSYMSDFDTTIYIKGKGIYINIFFVFNGSVPIRQEVNQMREILKKELGQVFEFHRLKINFQIKTINVNSEKRDFSSKVSDKEQLEDEERPSQEVIHREAELEDEDSLIGEEDLQGKKARKETPWHV